MEEGASAQLSCTGLVPAVKTAALLLEDEGEVWRAAGARVVCVSVCVCV